MNRTVQVGKLADLVVLAADPARDIRNTRQITHVIKGGHITMVRAETAAQPAIVLRQQ